jgi:hypothetical protein
VLLSAFFLLPYGVLAQGTASIVGYIVDSSGASMARVKVHLTEQDTGFTYEALTDSAGAFLFPELPVGNYRLAAETQGFRQYEQKDIRIQVGERKAVKIEMQVGQASEFVTVNAAPPLVNTVSGELSTVVDQQKMQDLPLNGRDPLQLMTLVAGVAPIAGGSQKQAFTYASTFVSSSGGRPNAVNFVLEGGSNNDHFTDVAQPFPNPDALAEFQFKTNNFTAEYGNAQGGVVDAVIRSGTNQFHGSAFEFVRNYDMNATNFFTPGRTDGLKRNQFGFTFGGPVILPRYNGHDKTFFFASFQDTKIRQTPATSTTFSPTQAERNGDFSGLGTPIIDPSTGLQFPGNQIPVSRFSAPAVGLLNYLPAPPAGATVLQYVKPVKTDEFQWIGKLDHSFSDHEKLSASLLFTDQNNLPSLQANNLYTASVAISIVVPTANLNLASTLRPNLINVAHISFSRYDSLYRGAASPTNFNNLGVQQPNLDPVSLGNTTVSNYFSVCNCYFPERVVQNPLQFRDDLSWIKGRHELKFGAEYIWRETNVYSTFNNQGAFTFGGQFSKNNLTDFFLGLPSSYSLQNAFYEARRQNVFAFYLQDNYRVSRRLTVNLGLRYEPFLAPYDRYNNEGVVFTPGHKSQRFPNAPVGMIFPGDPGVNGEGVPNGLSHFTPRIGFAFDPLGNGKMSIRGGYGVFYESQDENVDDGTSQTQPFIEAITITPPKSFAQPFAGQPPFDTTLAGSSRFVFTPPISLFGSFPLDYRVGYVQQWNLSVERQLPAAMLFRVAYAGSKGTHLSLINEKNPGLYSPGATTANINQRRVYGAQFGAIREIDSSGLASYNSLQLTVEKQWRGNFSLLANYSWQKALDDISYMAGSGNTPVFNPFNNRLSWAPSDYSVPQRFVTSALWSLPRLIHSARLVRETLGGWQLNGIVTVASGLPFTVTSGADNSLSSLGLDHADQVLPDASPSGGRTKSDRLHQWFNTAAFRTNAIGTFGNTGRNILRGPGLGNVDASLLKYFSITEKTRLQFRAEAFNLFNRANFNNPTANVSSPTNGQILSAGPARVLQLALKVQF